jgi:hypothetical protein
MKIHSVGSSCSMWTDGQTDGRAGRRPDMTTLIVAFRNFANVRVNDICKIEIAFSKRVCACAWLSFHPAYIHSSFTRGVPMVYRGIMLKYNLKKMGLRVSIIVAQLSEQLSKYSKYCNETSRSIRGRELLDQLSYCYKSISFRGDRFQLKSRCEGFPTFRELTPETSENRILSRLSAREKLIELLLSS